MPGWCNFRLKPESSQQRASPLLSAAILFYSTLTRSLREAATAKYPVIAKLRITHGGVAYCLVAPHVLG